MIGAQKGLSDKLNLIKTYNRAGLTLNVPLNTVITSNHSKCDSSFFNCVLSGPVLSYQVLQDSQYSLTNIILKNLKGHLKMSWRALF